MRESIKKRKKKKKKEKGKEKIGKQETYVVPYKGTRHARFPVARCRSPQSGVDWFTVPERVSTRSAGLAYTYVSPRRDVLALALPRESQSSLST